MRSSCVPLACGVAVLLMAGCTGDPEPAEAPPEGEPAPLPTEFEGAPPPGLEGEVLRHLHGEGADVHDMLDDGRGVRISPVGGAFLISSDGEDRHLLHDAATGEALWEGEAGFRGFDTDLEGGPVLLMAGEEETTFVLGAEGEELWSDDGGDEVYLDGVVVRYPGEWSAEEPDGGFAVLDTDGEELWSYTFDSPEEEPEEDGDSEEETDTDPEEDAEPSYGVPVAAWDGTVLLSDGVSALHAHSLDADEPGEELWKVDGEDDSMELPAPASQSVPQVLGHYTLPEEDDGDERDEEGDGEEDEEGPEEDEETVDTALLLRWTQPEGPSTLSAHDPADGDLLWTLEEPGTNPPPAPFAGAGAGAAGSLHDTETGTLILPQASGQATAIALSLTDGEVLWGLEDEDGAISPAFAFGGLFYGDQRTNEGTAGSQIVLDALTMDVVEDDLTARVEAVTDTGHAILVQGRQRFVHGPPPGEEDEPSEEESPGQETPEEE